MNKTIIVTLITVSILSIAFSMKDHSSIEFPQNTDFRLSSHISNSTLNAGDLIVIDSEIENRTIRQFKISYGAADNGASGLIHISIKPTNNDEYTITNPILNLTVLRPKQKLTDQQSFRLVDTGIYKIHITTNFYIEDPHSKKRKTYKIELEPVTIQVK